MNRQQVNLRLPAWLVDWMRTHGDCSQSRMVEDAIIARYGLCPPQPVRKARKTAL